MNFELMCVQPVHCACSLLCVCQSGGDMTDSERIGVLCQEFCSGLSSQDVPRTLARDIQSGTTDLLPIVEALGVYLTSTAVDSRCQGTRLLSEVLAHLHSYQLPQDDVHYLASFYCDRLKDRAVVIPHVLHGLHAMVVYQKIFSDDVVDISQAVFREIHNQSLAQGERRLVYTILDFFLSDHTEALTGMGSNFVLGYIQAMDGEKDPRNLVIAFSSVHRIVLHLPFDVLAEDLFEVTSCYFPIEFTPPPNDPHAVSKQQLVQELRKCLTASPKFAEFCLPLMLEKLSSDLLSAKLDSLLTLAAGCETFGVKALHTYLLALWMAIRKEIFQCVSQDVEAAGVQCLTAISRALSPPVLPGRGGGGGELHEFTEMVLKECQRHLVEPELRLLSPASRMLQAVASGCDQACAAITMATVPVLLGQFTRRTMVSQKKVLLQVLLEFVGIVKEFSQEDALSPLDPHKAVLLSLLVPVLQGREKALALTGLDLLCGLLPLPGYLDSEEVEQLAEHAKQLALSHRDTSVREKASHSLECAAQHYPHVARDTLLPALLQLTLPMQTNQDLTERVSLPSVARVLASVSTDLSLQAVTLPALLGLLETLAEQPFSQEHADLAGAVTGSMCSVVEKTVRTPEGLVLVHETAVNRVMMLCMGPSLATPPPTRHMCMEEAVLRNFLAALRTFTLAASSDPKISDSWAALIRQVFVENNSTLLPNGSSFLPLEASSPHQQTLLVRMLTATLGVMTRQVVCRQAPEYLPRLLGQATHCPHTPSSTHSAMCYASIVNKTRGEDLGQFLDSDMASLWQRITDSAASDDKTRTRSLTTWLWLTKALVLRSHPQGKSAAIKLFDLFGDARLSSHAADCFSVLLTDTEEVLNTKCHAVVRLMHKQQFFMEVVPELVRRFYEAPLGERQYFLRALSYIMQGVPRQVLLGELPSLLPLLLESLAAEDAGLRQSTLDGLHSLVQDTPSAVCDHVPTILPRLLLLARAPDSMKIRSSALSCLNALSKLPRHLVYPYQNQVIQGLAPCLDDKKRVVRREAVKSRSNWFMLDSVDSV